jgi:DNA-binding XRE family transcriptional regulator
MSELQEMVDEELKDPEFKKIWDAGETEYQVTRLLIKARNDAGISQQQLAEASGIKQPNISAIEKGTRAPSIETLSKIAKGLGKRLKIEFV